MGNESQEIVLKLTIDTSDFDKALDLSLEKIQHLKRELAELQEMAGGVDQYLSSRFVDRVGQAIAELTRRGDIDFSIAP